MIWTQVSIGVASLLPAMAIALAGASYRHTFLLRVLFMACPAVPSEPVPMKLTSIYRVHRSALPAVGSDSIGWILSNWWLEVAPSGSMN